jgi:geranylgeranyl pyrophosphate synthase
MFHAHRLDQTREEYEARIYGKTASLFAGAAEMGAILGEAPEDDIQALRRYGSDFGMAFQIVDDLLDLTGGTDDLGKPAGNDLRQGTVTLPTLIYAGRLVDGSPRWQALRRVVSGDSADQGEIDAVIDDIRASGAIDEAFAVADAYAESAKSRIRHLPDCETVDLLTTVADFALHRVS